MEPTGGFDAKGQALYACANPGCDARGFMPHGKPPTWRINGYGDFCGRPHEMHAPTQPGLGDRVAMLLASCGLTVERYIALKVRLGYPAECGCATRKAWLNRRAWLNRATMPSWWFAWATAKTRPAWQPLALLLRRLP